MLWSEKSTNIGGINLFNQLYWFRIQKLESWLTTIQMNEGHWSILECRNQLDDQLIDPFWNFDTVDRYPKWDLCLGHLGNNIYINLVLSKHPITGKTRRGFRYPSKRRSGILTGIEDNNQPVSNETIWCPYASARCRTCRQRKRLL